MKLFASEAALCAEFKTWLQGRGFASIYSEVSDWDMVCVGSPKHVGTTFYSGPDSALMHVDGGLTAPVGIQAKQVANVDVLYQASQLHGPVIRCVLVPRASYEFLHVAGCMGLAVAHAEQEYNYYGVKKHRRVEGGFKVQLTPTAYRQLRAFWLPPIAADLPAGVQSPKQLTKWRVKALALCRMAREQGYLTTDDFRKEKVDHRRWITEGWMVKTEEVAFQVDKKKRMKYVLGQHPPDEGWETISAQIAATTKQGTNQ